MRVVMFYHSLVSDWNHGNAHFLRGVATELIERGHEVALYEDRNAWSVRNLVAERGTEELEAYRAAYPELRSVRYDSDTFDVSHALRRADLVLVHEWNAPELVAQIGAHHDRNRCYTLLFHDTHHRAVTQESSIRHFDLSGYDGVLVFGRALMTLYSRRGWAERVWTWHEAADTRIFKPLRPSGPLNDSSPPAFDGDVVWIGNWGDDERGEELRHFLLRPVRELGLKAKVYGVRYPESALKELQAAGIAYGGWIPNYKVPEVFARYRITVHIPRRPYVEALPGIPTIRVFEALACGIPLICSPWEDTERLFTPGRDYLIARSASEMEHRLARLLAEPSRASEQAEHGRRTILERHTCAHRVDELLRIHSEIQAVHAEASA